MDHADEFRRLRESTSRTTLALLQSTPELVSLAVAHEPPLAELLDDRLPVRARRKDIVATFREDEIAGIRKFFSYAALELPEDRFQQMFGNRTPADIANDRCFYLHELEGTSGRQPDPHALRAVRDRLVIGIGEASAGVFCDRTSRALGAELGVEPTLFPGGHVGFVENPAVFAARLREVVR